MSLNSSTATQTSLFEQMQTYMDESSKHSCYSVTELNTLGNIYTSYFKTLKDAKRFAKKFTPKSSVIYIYKSSCLVIYEAESKDENQTVDVSDNQTVEEQEQDPDYDPSLDLSNMILTKYLKGFLLTPPEDSDYYGEKYFHNGWWVNKHGAWFFKAQYEDWLIEHGAQFEVDETEFTIDDDHNDNVDISNMTLERFGKGYLLIPDEDSPHWGEKYFLNGWWNTRQRAWFFKEEHYDSLVAMMNVQTDEFVEDEEDGEVTEVQQVSNDPITIEVSEVDEDETEDWTNMCFEDYGKGFLLKAPESDSRYGTKYFHGGFWIHKSNGWFFRSCYEDKLLSNGAKYIKTEDEYDVINNNYTPNFVKYGKGWLLKPDSVYKFTGDNYYLCDDHGWWVSSVEGWFFKNHQKDEFMNNH